MTAALQVVEDFKALLEKSQSFFSNLRCRAPPPPAPAHQHCAAICRSTKTSNGKPFTRKPSRCTIRCTSRCPAPCAPDPLPPALQLWKFQQEHRWTTIAHAPMLSLLQGDTREFRLLRPEALANRRDSFQDRAVILPLLVSADGWCAEQRSVWCSLRTSELLYLREAYVFYEAIRSRGYFQDVFDEQR